MVKANSKISPVNRIAKFFEQDVEEINVHVGAGLPAFRVGSGVGFVSPNSGFSPTGSGVQKVSFLDSDLFTEFVPRLNRDRLREARAIRKTVNVINSLVNFKLDLYTKQFSISDTKPLSKKVKAFAETWKISDIQKELHDDLLTGDNCVIIWQKKNGTVKTVMRVPPEEVDVFTLNGKDFLSLHLDAQRFLELQKIIDNPKKHDPELVREARRMPRTWFDAARKGKPIPLTRKDGWDYIIKRKFASVQENGLCSPSMMTIKTDSLILYYLQIAEFTTAYNLKNLILHIKQGETVIENGVVNKKLYTSVKKIRAIRRHLNNLEKSIKLYTDHTVSLEYIHPPIELFKKEKYESVHFRVINVWGGLPNALFAGDSKTSIGSAFVSLKRPNIEGWANRDTIASLLREFFSKAMQIKLPMVPNIGYDNDALRDERLKLDIIKFMTQWGNMDSLTMIKEFGYDPESINAGIKTDQKNKKLRVPVFEPSQGITAEVHHGISKNKASGPDGEAGAPPGDKAAPVGDEKVTGPITRSDR